MSNFPIPGNFRRCIHLLPNVFTTASLFAGFYALIQVLNNCFETAFVSIFVAMILDGMDGKVARFTNTQSTFGEHYDSLSDMTSFGVTPALLIYKWILYDLGSWGWLAASIYVACAALRLARFNVSTDTNHKNFFQGLPSPAAAALVISFVWLSIEHELYLYRENLKWFAFTLTMYSGINMVSRAPFFSGKNFVLKKNTSFWTVFLAVVICFLALTNLSIILFVIFSIYSTSGWAVLLWHWTHAPQSLELGNYKKRKKEMGIKD